MITIGVDAHKRVHVAYAIDEAGREIGQWRGANSASGWRQLFAWANEIRGERQWGIEGAWSYGRNLAQFLVGCGETVFDVNPRWTAFGRTTSYDYDAAGNVIERTDARGLVTEYEYDALNRLTLVEHWDGETLVDDVDYTYDDVGNRLTMVDDTGTTEYAYDDLDRPTSVTFPGDDTVAYQYDDLPGGSAADYPGLRTLLTYPDAKEVEYTYDEADNLETVTDWLDNTTTYTYDDAGNLTDTDLPNGVATGYTYDDAGRLTNVANKKAGPTTISSFAYTLDAVGNRTAMEDLDGTHSYEYDALYRLTEVTYPDQETDAYTYDPVGNRLTKDTDDYTYDAADQLTDLEGTSFGYDDNGNQTSRGNDTFEYDHENRLTASDIDSVGATYEYNGDGLRVTRTIDQTSVSYIWEVAAGLPVVLQDSDGNTYVYGLDLISLTDDQGDQEYYLYDGLGSTTELTDGDGDMAASYRYDVFGAIRSQTGSSPNEFTFTGEQVDGTGLQYLRARYYDPATGRFLSQDPVPGFMDEPATQNPYVYALDDPCAFVDPAGSLARESGFSITICHASATGKGLGRVLPGFPRDDLLWKTEATVIFFETPFGTYSQVAAEQPQGYLGWQRDGIVVSKTADDSAVSVRGFAHSGALNVSGYSTLRFCLHCAGEMVTAEWDFEASGLIGPAKFPTRSPMMKVSVSGSCLSIPTG